MGHRRNTHLRDILADELRRRRGERSQRQFALQLGIGRSTYNRIEMGEENLTLNTLDTICKRLGISIGQLFGDVE
ncbi:helix-turn-helix domain-containing protein [Candidatus Entotheonella palauensis]|uniref:helix-turn-helix domain-containing protein n=1 Tax=Candidatus Entotheonella palauensis TaxID=93172 RepID=UPI000B7D14D6|nr:helix-turn-helix transcriptional regulator [Candidatus Entotheonella palauensis]